MAKNTLFVYFKLQWYVLFLKRCATVCMNYNEKSFDIGRQEVAKKQVQTMPAEPLRSFPHPSGRSQPVNMCNSSLNLECVPAQSCC